MNINNFNFGSIYWVPDKKINFPKTLFKRTTHQSRTVVILENSIYNNDDNEDCILIAPLSSNNVFHPKDIKISKNSLNNLSKDSYIRMRAIQFIEKINFTNYVGELSDDEKAEALLTISSYINLV